MPLKTTLCCALFLLTAMSGARSTAQAQSPAVQVERYRKLGGTKPYVLTEFGPPGIWEIHKDDVGAFREPTSTAKADSYRLAPRPPTPLFGVPGRGEAEHKSLRDECRTTNSPRGDDRLVRREKEASHPPARTTGFVN